MKLTDADIATLLTPCECGHTINDHGELAGCWACGDGGGDCRVSFEALLTRAVEAISQRRVNQALTEAADAIEVERRHLDRSDRISFATGCYRAERIVRARIT